MLQVSVIIPTYNRRELLKRALKSVLAQKGVFFEVIAIDDGSTDGTDEMVATEFPAVRYFRQERYGPSAARNRGIERAQSPWLAFLDSDDEWGPGKLRAQLDFFEQNRDIRICQTEEIWIRNGKRVNPMKKHKKFGGWIFEHCLPLCIISPSAVMIHKTIFENTGIFDESFPACEDYDLWLRIAARYPVGLIETPYVIKYGGHEDQRSHEFPVMDFFRIRALIKLMRSEILSEEQTLQVKAVLESKIKIVLQGAKKRHNTGMAERIRGLAKNIINPEILAPEA